MRKMPQSHRGLLLRLPFRHAAGSAPGSRDRGSGITSIWCPKTGSAATLLHRFTGEQAIFVLKTGYTADQAVLIGLTNFFHSVIDPAKHTINLKWEVPDAEKVIYYLDAVLRHEGMFLYSA